MPLDKTKQSTPMLTVLVTTLIPMMTVTLADASDAFPLDKLRMTLMGLVTTDTDDDGDGVAERLGFDQ